MQGSPERGRQAAGGCPSGWPRPPGWGTSGPGSRSPRQAPVGTWHRCGDSPSPWPALPLPIPAGAVQAAAWGWAQPCVPLPAGLSMAWRGSQGHGRARPSRGQRHQAGFLQAGRGSRCQGCKWGEAAGARPAPRPGEMGWGGSGGELWALPSACLRRGNKPAGACRLVCRSWCISPRPLCSRPPPRAGRAPPPRAVGRPGRQLEQEVLGWCQLCRCQRQGERLWGGGNPGSIPPGLPGA